MTEEEYRFWSLLVNIATAFGAIWVAWIAAKSMRRSNLAPILIRHFGRLHTDPSEKMDNNIRSEIFIKSLSAKKITIQSIYLEHGIFSKGILELDVSTDSNPGELVGDSGHELNPMGSESFLFDAIATTNYFWFTVYSTNTLYHKLVSLTIKLSQSERKNKAIENILTHVAVFTFTIAITLKLMNTKIVVIDTDDRFRKITLGSRTRQNMVNHLVKTTFRPIKGEE